MNLCLCHLHHVTQTHSDTNYFFFVSFSFFLIYLIFLFYWLKIGVTYLLPKIPYSNVNKKKTTVMQCWQRNEVKKFGKYTHNLPPLKNMLQKKSWKELFKTEFITQKLSRHTTKNVQADGKEHTIINVDHTTLSLSSFTLNVVNLSRHHHITMNLFPHLLSFSCNFFLTFFCMS